MSRNLIAALPPIDRARPFGDSLERRERPRPRTARSVAVAAANACLRRRRDATPSNERRTARAHFRRMVSNTGAALPVTSC